MSFNTNLPEFDTLVAMHREDPESFESYRRDLLRQAVDCAPAVHRADLEQLLDRIEETRAAAATPSEAAYSAFCMMRDSVNRLNRTWKRAHYAVAGLQAELITLRLRQ